MTHIKTHTRRQFMQKFPFETYPMEIPFWCTRYSTNFSSSSLPDQHISATLRDFVLYTMNHNLGLGVDSGPSNSYHVIYRVELLCVSSKVHFANLCCVRTIRHLWTMNHRTHSDRHYTYAILHRMTLASDCSARLFCEFVSNGIICVTWLCVQSALATFSIFARSDIRGVNIPQLQI